MTDPTPTTALPSDPDPDAVEVRPGVWRHWGIYLRGAPTDPTPTTEAGRAVAYFDGPDTPITIEEILAIEAEARAEAGRIDWYAEGLKDGRSQARTEALDLAAERVRAMPSASGKPYYVSRSAVLAILTEQER